MPINTNVSENINENINSRECANSHASAPPKILLIEDDASARESIGNFLTDAGFAVITANNGREGIKIFGRETPDLVITDIKMPELDGHEVMKFVRVYAADTPVIVISGSESLNDVVESLKLGAWDYFIKPIYDYNVVGIAVQRALERKKLIAENNYYREYLEMERERNELKKQINAAQKMELIGLLTSGIAHDFNNVLSALSGYASMLHSRLDKTDSTANEFAEKIKEISAKGQALTGRLMSFIRKKRDELVPVDVHKVLNDTESMLRPNNKNINIRLNLQASDYIILGDESQIQSAILNLGLNSCDAMPNGGELTFATSNTTTVNSQKMLQIKVIDTGVGMDDDLMKKIFEPLFTTKAPGAGTGLGLPGVQYCVKNLHGFLDVSSKINEGTTFTITLPLFDEGAETLDMNGIEYEIQRLKSKMKNIGG